MDIYIIKIVSADEVHKQILKEFQKKEFTDEEAWNRHCLSYLMLDRILREVYSIENREIIFDNKKPKLAFGEKMFSISHSKEYIALAFSDSNCGIDIEKNSPRDFKKISERMNFNTNSEEEFYRLWTRYEAEFKLGENIESEKTFLFEDYTITAVSSNLVEKFEIFVQNN